MIGLKCFIRPGLVVSVIGHVGALLLGLLLVGANSFESVPPDAMVVDIVPPNKAPRFEGTPSNLRSSGSESSLKSNNANAAAQHGCTIAAKIAAACRPAARRPPGESAAADAAA